MTNGVTPLLVGLAMAVATGTSVALAPIHKPNEDLAFLERVATTAERANVIAPDTRDYLSGLISRHRFTLADHTLDLRQKAIERITAAAQPADEFELDGRGPRNSHK